VGELRDSRRWQLRRPVVLPAGFDVVDGVVDQEVEAGRSEPLVMCSRSGEAPSRPALVRCPYGRRDDWLWCREAYRLEGARQSRHVVYEADAASEPAGAQGKRWISALLMPVGAARIWLRIYNVRAQRLQAIRDFDVSSEGVACPAHDTPDTYCLSGECEARRAVFVERWDARYGATPASWSRNPMVWAVSVTRFSPQMARVALEQDAAALEAERMRDPRGRTSTTRRAAARR
jgi:hypothetical protein